MVALSLPGNNRSDFQPDRIAFPGIPPASGRRAGRGIPQAAGTSRTSVSHLPPTSPLCKTAVTACHESLVVIGHRDRLVLRVAPNEFIVDEVRIGGGTIIEHELSRRLSRARVRTLEIDRATSPRDVSRFCTDLVQSEELDTIQNDVRRPPGRAWREHHRARHGASARGARDRCSLIAALRAHGVRTAKATSRLISPDAPVSYLYPPDKGWVRHRSVPDARRRLADGPCRARRGSRPRSRRCFCG